MVYAFDVLYFFYIENQRSKKFWHAGIEPSLCSKFDRMFSNVVAIRHHAWTLSSGTLYDDDNDVNQSTQDVNKEENLEKGSGDLEKDVISNYTKDVYKTWKPRQ